MALQLHTSRLSWFQTNSSTDWTNKIKKIYIKATGHKRTPQWHVFTLIPWTLHDIFILNSTTLVADITLVIDMTLIVSDMSLMWPFSPTWSLTLTWPNQHEPCQWWPLTPRWPVTVVASTLKREGLFSQTWPIARGSTVHKGMFNMMHKPDINGTRRSLEKDIAWVSQVYLHLSISKMFLSLRKDIAWVSQVYLHLSISKI